MTFPGHHQQRHPARADRTRKVARPGGRDGGERTLKVQAGRLCRPSDGAARRLCPSIRPGPQCVSTGPKYRMLWLLCLERRLREERAGPLLTMTGAAAELVQNTAPARAAASGGPALGRSSRADDPGSRSGWIHKVGWRGAAQFRGFHGMRSRALVFSHCCDFHLVVPKPLTKMSKSN